MSILRELRKLVLGPVTGKDRAEAVRLRTGIVQHFEAGRYPEAAAEARSLLELQRRLLGELNPDYATGLSNLSLILQRQEDWSGAESVLRQALTIRKVTQGEHHPNYLANLRYLDEFRRRREDRVKTGPGPIRVEVEDEGPAPSASQALAREATALADAQVRFAEILSRAARKLLETGSPPPEPLAKDLADSRRGFLAFQARVLLSAEAEHVAPDAAGPLDSLSALSALIARIAEAERTNARADDAQRQARSLLDRIEGLAHRFEPNYRPLDACRAEARALRRAFAERAAGPADSERLLPFAALGTLIDPPAALSDDPWEGLRADIAKGFGPALAAAAARGRLASAPPSDPAPDPDPSDH